jgi:hypothetical protein
MRPQRVSLNPEGKAGPRPTGRRPWCRRQAMLAGSGAEGRADKAVAAVSVIVTARAQSALRTRRGWSLRSAISTSRFDRQQSYWILGFSSRISLSSSDNTAIRRMTSSWDQGKPIDDDVDGTGETGDF